MVSEEKFLETFDFLVSLTKIELVGSHPPRDFKKCNGFSEVHDITFSYNHSFKFDYFFDRQL